MTTRTSQITDCSGLWARSSNPTPYTGARSALVKRSDPVRDRVDLALVADLGKAEAPLTAPSPAVTVSATTLALNETWQTLDTTRWGVQTTAYGATNDSIGAWSAANVSVVDGVEPGGGKCLQLRSTHATAASWVGGMLGSRDASTPRFYPRFGYFEFWWCPANGKALWPALWLRHVDGSSTCEVDIDEQFGGETPGHQRFTLHRRATAGGSTTYNLGKTNTKAQASVAADGTSPAAPVWRKVGVLIRPTDLAQWDAASVASVTFECYLNGTLVASYVDTQAGHWTSFDKTAMWDICIQGAQIGGQYIGHPDDPPGQTRFASGGGGLIDGSGTTRCILGGTVPSCTLTFNGNRIPGVAGVAGSGTDWSLAMSTTWVGPVRVWTR